MKKQHSYHTLINRFLWIFLGILIYSCNMQKSENPMIIGHRGAMGYETENTLASIDKAVALGAPMIEIDVFQIASGELVVFHDNELDRLSNASGPITSFTWEALQEVVLEGGHSIPLLTTVLDQLAGRAALNIELKGPYTAGPVASLLKDYLSRDVWVEQNLIISSFDWTLLLETRELLPEISIGVLTEAHPLDAIPIAKQLSAVAINPYYKDLDAAIVAQIHAAGFKVYTWTVNAPEDLKNAKILGVDAVFTNYPDRTF
jgi:glycerophosphoryl diester phosphodiesterase